MKKRWQEKKEKASFLSTSDEVETTMGVEKYRPAKLAEVVGQAEITKRLERFS